MRTPLLLTAALLLPGCQSSTPQSLPVIPPADLTAPCDPLPKRAGDDADAVVTYATRMAYQYHECEAKQAALATWSKEINQ